MKHHERNVLILKFICARVAAFWGEAKKKKVQTVEKESVPSFAVECFFFSCIHWL